MSSQLSIINNTQDPWFCRLGATESTLPIASIAISVIGSVTGFLGASAPFTAALTASNIVAVSGVSTAALTPYFTGAMRAAAFASVEGTYQVSIFGLGVAKTMADRLEEEGFRSILPGQTYQSHKLGLSQWQQGTCVKTVIENTQTLHIETMYMRPLHTGATDKSNIDYEISEWIKKAETEKLHIIVKGEDEQPRSAAIEVVTARPVVEANRTRTTLTEVE